MYQGSTVLTRVFLFLVLIVSVSALVSGCSQKLSEEVVLHRIIERVASSAGVKNIEGIFSYISKDFTDNHDNDYKSLRAFVFYKFFQSGDVNVVVRSVDVSAKEAQAVVNMRLLLVREKDIEGVGVAGAEATSSLSVSLAFNKEDGRWKAQSASWREAGALGGL